MTLRRDEWIVLEDLGNQPDGAWITGIRPLEKRYRASTAVRDVAERGLCDLATDEVLDGLTSGGSRPDWAARITPLGRTVLTYRALQDNPRPTIELAPVPEGFKVRGSDVDVLRAALAAAEAGALAGIDAPALRTALAGAVPVSGSRQHTLTTGEDGLAAVIAVLHLESLVRDSSGYHHLLRQLPPFS
ncbi:hypothetical protein ADK60_29930 [Streptomyces sp. XY431]|uniref:hypothetical protein n=1 Tax=Streptomyces sp. XY431 TaxID=1415562 RepID=UPI0006AFA880|nr:hypothetical protein [Streptomyces sp. XY431]KOV13316.1 hypothetical protein ADK60_29930 [Streptomyces sp. XY431]